MAGLDHLNEVMSQIQCPVAIHHGSNDRVTSPDGSRAFFDRLHVQPKMLRIWPGIEHAMLKSTPEMDVRDVERRNALIQDIVGTPLTSGLLVLAIIAKCIDSLRLQTLRVAREHTGAADVTEAQVEH